MVVHRNPRLYALLRCNCDLARNVRPSATRLEPDFQPVAFAGFPASLFETGSSLSEVGFFETTTDDGLTDIATSKIGGRPVFTATGFSAWLSSVDTLNSDVDTPGPGPGGTGVAGGRPSRTR